MNFKDVGKVVVKFSGSIGTDPGSHNETTVLSPKIISRYH